MSIKPLARFLQGSKSPKPFKPVTRSSTVDRHYHLRAEAHPKNKTTDFINNFTSNDNTDDL